MRFDNDPEIQRLAAEAHAAFETYQKAVIALSKAKMARFPVAPGDIVESTSRRTLGQRFKVEAVNPDYDWVKGHRRTKAGEWSKQTSNLFENWKKVTEDSR